MTRGEAEGRSAIRPATETSPEKKDGQNGTARDAATVAPRGNADVRALCPVCGNKTLDAKPHGGKGSLYCFYCEPRGAEKNRAWLNEAAAALECRPFELLAKPLDHLTIVSRAASVGGPTRLPSLGKVGGWHSRLLARNGAAALDWLRGRGLSATTIEQFELGYDGDGDAITIPVYEDGELVNLKWRFLDPDAARKIVGCRGPSRLYPLDVLSEDAPIVLHEGELDTLLLVQAGFIALTSTAGTNWKPEWARYVAGRRVAVMYDAGSYDKCARRAVELAAQGAADAWPVDLGRELPVDGDSGDWFAGRTADDLRCFLNAERQRWRREAR